jgi:hypothetical protein
LKKLVKALKEEAAKNRRELWIHYSKI